LENKRLSRIPTLAVRIKINRTFSLPSLSFEAELKSFLIPQPQQVLCLAIRKLLVKSTYGPEDVALLCAVYDEVIRRLHLPRVPQPLAEAFARKVIDIAKTGERDYAHFVERVFSDIGIRMP
jgi:hypothetical protein